jgi:vesicular inhibitory amino acid transporter
MGVADVRIISARSLVLMFIYLIRLVPTVFLPLSLLSYASVLGIISTLLIIIVILVDGFSKADGPGSLWKPAHTTLGVQSPVELGIAFGLFMAGFSGHVVVPSLARDMIRPEEFDKMIDWAFVRLLGSHLDPDSFCTL